MAKTNVKTQQIFYTRPNFDEEIQNLEKLNLAQTDFYNLLQSQKDSMFILERSAEQQEKMIKDKPIIEKLNASQSLQDVEINQTLKVEKDFVAPTNLNFNWNPIVFKYTNLQPKIKYLRIDDKRISGIELNKKDFSIYKDRGFIYISEMVNDPDGQLQSDVPLGLRSNNVEVKRFLLDQDLKLIIEGNAFEIETNRGSGSVKLTNLLVSKDAVKKYIDLIGPIKIRKSNYYSRLELMLSDESSDYTELEPESDVTS